MGAKYRNGASLRQKFQITSKKHKIFKTPAQPPMLFTLANMTETMEKLIPFKRKWAILEKTWLNNV
jgi:hypothetical protein